MKKKKKSKKAALDLDAFEKELEGISKPAAAEDVDEDAEERLATEYDEAELGDNVFAAPLGGVGGEVHNGDSVETWLGTDRDYTYAEVSLNSTHVDYRSFANS
jgi:translation initiation factor 2 subunit 2